MTARRLSDILKTIAKLKKYDPLAKALRKEIDVWIHGDDILCEACPWIPGPAVPAPGIYIDDIFLPDWERSEHNQND